MKIETEWIDKTHARKGPSKRSGKNLDYWLSQPPEARLAELERIRQEYNEWKYGPDQEFQRICRVVKRK